MELATAVNTMTQQGACKLFDLILNNKRLMWYDSEGFLAVNLSMLKSSNITLSSKSLLQVYVAR